MSSSRSWGVVSQHALQVSRPIPKGEVEGDLAGGVSPGPHPRGKLRRSGLGRSPGPHLGGVPAPGGLLSGGVWRTQPP